MAQLGQTAVAEAAQRALENPDPAAAERFITTDAANIQGEDYRRQILKLMDGAGPAVTEAGNAALTDGSVPVMLDFLMVGLRDAVMEDDRVKTLALMNTGGANVKATAEVVMAGPAWMRHDFVNGAYHKAAQLDQDTATHVAAIRASIANAARVAAKAHEDAARASEAAAKARNAAAEAAEWADKAQQSATQASHHAQAARDSADAADASAAAAAASAQKATTAEQTACTAARYANYSANRASASAQQAQSSAAFAQSQATAARASALAAGRDAEAASAAASDAHRIAADKRAQEQAAAAAAAAEKAR